LIGKEKFMLHGNRAEGLPAHQRNASGLAWHNGAMDVSEKLVFLDLETTGANAVFDRITEIGLVEVDGAQVTHWSTLVNPGRPIPPFIERLTGISNRMVAAAPPLEEVLEPVLERLRGALFIAHNARFDHGFLSQACARAGRTLDNDVLCTVRLSRRLFPAERRHNLDALIERHRLVTGERHRALADADLLWQLWRRLDEQFAPEVLRPAVEALRQRRGEPASARKRPRTPARS